MISKLFFCELSKAVYRFVLRCAGAEIDGGMFKLLPPSGGGKSRGPSGREIANALAGGVRRPPSDSRTADRSETSYTAFESSLDETVLKRPLSFQNEVTCQAKVMSKVKIRGFQVTDRRDLKYSSFGPKLSPNSPKPKK